MEKLDWIMLQEIVVDSIQGRATFTETKDASVFVHVLLRGIQIKLVINLARTEAIAIADAENKNPGATAKITMRLYELFEQMEESANEQRRHLTPES